MTAKKECMALLKSMGVTLCDNGDSLFVISAEDLFFVDGKYVEQADRYTQEIHPAILEALETYNLDFEWYDPGTLHVYEA